MNIFIVLLVWLVIATPGWAESATEHKGDTEGWSFSRVAVVDNPQDGRFIRLELTVDRGNSGLNQTPQVEAGQDYELKIEYRSSTEESARDKGSWLYLAFRDEKEKTVREQVQLFEKTATWKMKSVPFETPAGVTKVLISLRQQQRAGIFDIKSVELKQTGSNEKSAVTLSPAAMAAIKWILHPGLKLSPQGEKSPLDGNIFLPYLKGIAPSIVRELGHETMNEVLVKKVVFRSLSVGGEAQDVYAIITRPSATGRYPGLLWLHGGHGCADLQQAVRYAKAGYITIAVDLPGIGSPTLCPNSTGPWTKRWGKMTWTGMPDPTADETFDAVVAALQAFDLLAAQPDVIKDRMGISGISMGGYTTTMISGLLGKRVRAAYSKYGCGFYEIGSTWTKTLADMSDDQREAWLTHFDAGHRAANIQAPYFIAAAASDHFFWPPAVNATLSAIPGIKNHVYAPANHRLTGIPNDAILDLLYLGHWLKGEGPAFPTVKIESCKPLADGGKGVCFSVHSALPIQTATLYVTAGGESWESSTWEPIAAQSTGENRFNVMIPADKVNTRGAWFVNVSDARPATAGSLVYGMAAIGTSATLRPLGVNLEK